MTQGSPPQTSGRESIPGKAPLNSSTAHLRISAFSASGKELIDASNSRRLATFVLFQVSRLEPSIRSANAATPETRVTRVEKKPEIFISLIPSITYTQAATSKPANHVRPAPARPYLLFRSNPMNNTHRLTHNLPSSSLLSTHPRSRTPNSRQIGKMPNSPPAPPQQASPHPAKTTPSTALLVIATVPSNSSPPKIPLASKR